MKSKFCSDCGMELQNNSSNPDFNLSAAPVGDWSAVGQNPNLSQPSQPPAVSGSPIQRHYGNPPSFGLVAPQIFFDCTTRGLMAPPTSLNSTTGSPAAPQTQLSSDPTSHGLTVSQISQDSSTSRPAALQSAGPLDSATSNSVAPQPYMSFDPATRGLFQAHKSTALMVEAARQAVPASQVATLPWGLPITKRNQRKGSRRGLHISPVASALISASGNPSGVSNHSLPFPTYGNQQPVVAGPSTAPAPQPHRISRDIILIYGTRESISLGRPKECLVLGPEKWEPSEDSLDIMLFKNSKDGAANWTQGLRCFLVERLQIWRDLQSMVVPSEYLDVFPFDPSASSIYFVANWSKRSGATRLPSRATDDGTLRGVLEEWFPDPKKRVPVVFEVELPLFAREPKDIIGYEPYMWTEDRKKLFAVVEKEALATAETGTSPGQHLRQVVVTAATPVHHPASESESISLPQATTEVAPAEESVLADEAASDSSGLTPVPDEPALPPVKEKGKGKGQRRRNTNKKVST
jgi:hypothetical protein